MGSLNGTQPSGTSIFYNFVLYGCLKSSKMVWAAIYVGLIGYFYHSSSLNFFRISLTLMLDRVSRRC